ncbi:MAG: dihydroorotase [Caldisphaeraceae archaeon]|nr:dihydroorotase [Caldisphaeraceae archaeon]MEB3798411.1 dihydroorotase [Caldisphaeraceae archaeon]
MILSICGNLFDYRGSIGKGCINIGESGKIESVTKIPKARKAEEFGNGYIIGPGIIDLHVHLRGLELSYKEDEESGTKSALQSGITLVIDMPNTKPRLDSIDNIKKKLSSLKEMSYVDSSVFSAIPQKVEEIDKICDLPIAGFKVYPEDLSLREEAIRYVIEKGKLIVLHPELIEAERVFDYENDARATLRGCNLESASIPIINKISERRKRIHVTHTSCPSTVLEAKRHGFTVDTTPHHLFYESSMRGCQYRVNPPLRDYITKGNLFKLLIEGAVDMVCSDHAPHSIKEKENPTLCPPGIPWLGLWPWLFFKLVKLGIISIGNFFNLLSFTPARILGIKNLGYIGEGARANIVVIDSNARWRFTKTYSKAPYIGHFLEELHGFPVKVYVGGILASDSGEVIGRPPVINPFEVKDSLEKREPNNV